MKSILFTLISLLLLTAGWADPPQELEADKAGDIRITVTSNVNASLGVTLQTPIPPVVGFAWETYLPTAPPAAELIFNPDASSAQLVIPAFDSSTERPALLLESGRKSEQKSDGRIVFAAADARVVGTSAKLESHPGNDRVGFWTNVTDRVEWDYQPTRPGTYDVELMYSLNGEGQSDVVVSWGDHKLEQQITGTGSWYRYRVARLGTIKLASGEKHPLVVSGTKTTAGALMNLKSIVLRPAPEGSPIAQQESGEILCHSRDVTIHGVKVQYEPKPEKNTVGFWVTPSDWVSWSFAVTQPGKFQVEVLQGCGTGHGGSEVAIWVNDQKLEFTVEDTGHFQNFKPRIIGEVEIAAPGTAVLRIVPINKKSVAVMDVRQVRLLPVAAK